ncbi:hypothetical protein AAVH_05504 [Aphelenchoides avenae]|nr:hypothetical protein AAVH_05504 [Aphelenchus avenae]
MPVSNDSTASDTANESQDEPVEVAAQVGHEEPQLRTNDMIPPAKAEEKSATKPPRKRKPKATNESPSGDEPQKRRISTPKKKPVRKDTESSENGPGELHISDEDIFTSDDAKNEPQKKPVSQLPPSAQSKPELPVKTSHDLKPKRKANGTATSGPEPAKQTPPSRIYRSLAHDLPLRPKPQGVDLAAMFQTFIRDHQKEPARQVSQQEFEEAVMTGDIVTVRAALRGGPGSLDLNPRDAEGRSLLHRLCELKCDPSHTADEILDLLVSKGAKLDAKDARQEWLPIDYAIHKHRLCRLRKLLSLRSPINTTGRDGQTPLVRCFDCGDGDFMKALLLAGATFQPGY